MQIITLKTVMNAILVATFLVVSGCASETCLHGEPASSLSDVAIRLLIAAAEMSPPTSQTDSALSKEGGIASSFGLALDLQREIGAP